MTLRLAYNTTDAPVLVDGQGYVIGGHGWGVIETTDGIASRELGSERIIEADEHALAASSNPDALEAVEALRTRQAAQDAAQSLSKAELVETVDPDVVAGMDVGGDGLPAKADLVAAAAAEDVADGDVETPELADGAKPSTAKKAPRRGGQN